MRIAKIISGSGVRSSVEFIRRDFFTGCRSFRVFGHRIIAKIITLVTAFTLLIQSVAYPASCGCGVASPTAESNQMLCHTETAVRTCCSQSSGRVSNNESSCSLDLTNRTAECQCGCSDEAGREPVGLTGQFKRFVNDAMPIASGRDRSADLATNSSRCTFDATLGVEVASVSVQALLCIWQT